MCAASVAAATADAAAATASAAAPTRTMSKLDSVRLRDTVAVAIYW